VAIADKFIDRKIKQMEKACKNLILPIDNLINQEVGAGSTSASATVANILEYGPKLK
jgi:hypothetical protein